METNMGNSELLFEVIDTLSDEEFTELLDTLDVKEEAEEVVAQRQEEGGEDEPTGESLNAKLVKRKRLISEKLDELAEKEKVNKRRQIIQEKLDAAKKRKQIQEKLEQARKRAKVQEKLENIRNAQRSTGSRKSGAAAAADTKTKIQEKIELAKKKKQVMERVAAAKAKAAQK